MPEASPAQVPRHQSGPELQRIIALDRAGEPYLLLRDGSGELLGLALESAEAAVAVGRDSRCKLCLASDSAVSQLHAELVHRAGAWYVLDDGISTNGTYVNGQRVHGRRRLRDRDVLVFGSTVVLFRAGPDAKSTRTAKIVEELQPVHVSPAERRVLVELCRPLATGAVTSATNPDIASALVLSEESVKSHMRALFGRFGVAGLPQNAKRARLADLALATGTVRPGDLL